MKVTEAIILAGGFGTRLRSAIHDLPKCVAPVNGKPFIAYVIEYLNNQGIETFIFSLGYKHELIVKYLDEFHSSYQPRNSLSPEANNPLTFKYSIEEQSLGTGGAIKLGCTMASEENVIATNGDTLFKIDIAKLWDLHSKHNADCTLSLKPMKNFERYGIVELNDDNTIKLFKEKQYCNQGLINGGLYMLNARKFLEEELPTRFSFEKDYLEKFYARRKIYGVVQDSYFIDIGVPEDYERAQLELVKFKI